MKDAVPFSESMSLPVIRVETSESLLRCIEQKSDGIYLIDGKDIDMNPATICTLIRNSCGIKNPIVYLSPTISTPETRINFYNAEGDAFIDAEDREHIPDILERRIKQYRLNTSREKLEPVCISVIARMKVYPERLRLTIDDAEIVLTRKEMDVFRCIITAYPVLVPNSVLFQEVFGGVVEADALNTLVLKIRKKIQPFGFTIDNVRGVGKRLVDMHS